MGPPNPVRTPGGLFHTFQGVTPKKHASVSTGVSKTNCNGTTARRITTAHACAECKRRKIRCDGKQPCGQCRGSRAPKRCHYDEHRQRVIPSRKTLEALSQSLEECRSILSRLYPNHEAQELLPLSRRDLLNLLGSSIECTASALPSPPLDTLSVSDISFGASSRPKPPQARDTQWDEGHQQRDDLPNETDDVNILSLNVDRHASYLGASSIKTALMVMLKVQPRLRTLLGTHPLSVETTQSLPTIPHRPTDATEPQKVPWSWKGQTLIDAYFKRIHVFMPMLDEASFRSDYIEGQRSDAPWLALLNMVFAVGSVACMKSDDCNHFTYYSRAMENLPMDCFGGNHIETVQALGLLGGHYLHYINRPNMANSVLGATIRMACTLGLHRESHSQGNAGNSRELGTTETRRRTWWSLFCLDTWATTTTCRPSLGRWGPAVNIQPPETGFVGGRDFAQRAGAVLPPLSENVTFCKIATDIQDALAISPLMQADDRCKLDGQLFNWYSTLPWALRTSEPCAEPLYIARCIMKWRYQNLRMLLHRPVLLHMASSDASHATEHDIAAIEVCRNLAKQTIEDISREWAQNQVSGWSAVWFLYHAVMIPLVSIFWQWGCPQVSEWQQQMESVLELMEAMDDWSPVARKSREVVRRMYEASRQLGPGMREHNPLQLLVANNHGVLQPDDSAMHMSPIGLEPEGLGLMGLLDQQGLWGMNSMVWGSSPEEMQFPQQQVGGAQDAAMMHLGYQSIMGTQRQPVFGVEDVYIRTLGSG